MSDIEKPLVTFALFAYNQEQFIREAVEGAFAQTYEPLEIILSDDCSTDRTFEIIQEMAAEYKGPHSLRLNQNPKNLGLIGHVNKIFESASSEVIVLAAGDDISENLRVEKIADVFFKQPKVMLVHSSARIIDENRKQFGIFKPPCLGEDLISLATSESIYIGATGAIKASLVKTFGPISEVETYEDLIYGFRAALLDGLYYIDEPLVRYTSNIGIVSQIKRSHLTWRSRQIADIKHRIATLNQRLADIKKVQNPQGSSCSLLINREMDMALARLDFYTTRIKFASGFFSSKVYAHIKAASFELYSLVDFLAVKCRQKLR